MTSLVAPLACPSCGGPVLGRPGLEWHACVRCPLVFDPFDPGRATIPARRPAGDAEEGPRLPFFRIGLGGALPSPAWVNAFRVIGLQVHGDAGARLTESGFDPELVAAPLGAALARGPAAAVKLLRARLGLGEKDPLEVASIDLVSLPCRLDGAVFREPVSRLVYPRSLVLPEPLLSAEV